MAQAKHLGRFPLVAVALLVAFTAAQAHEPTGSLHGRVTDTAGESIAGASLELTGPQAPQLATTDSRGGFRFLRLTPARYELKVRLASYAPVDQPGIDIRIGRNTTLEIELPPADEEAKRLTVESPLLDERRISQGTLISRVELERIPTARDPWSALPQTPGVLRDRVDVGGSETGRQGAWFAPGAEPRDNDWYLDGVEVTDMMNLGQSMVSFDFDPLTSIEVRTGGSGIAKLTPGASIHLVTRRGTAQPRASARYFLTNGDGYLGALAQGDPAVSPGDLAPEQEAFTARTIDRIQELGAEAGGPISRDRVWLWGALSRKQVRIANPDGALDEHVIDHAALTLDARLTSANTLIGLWRHQDLTRERHPGAWRLYPSNELLSFEATVDLETPADVLSLEDAHLLTSEVLLEGALSRVKANTLGEPRAGIGPGDPEPLFDVDGILRHNGIGLRSDRSSRQLRLDATWFPATKSVGHEVRLGGRLREFESSEGLVLPLRGIFHIAGESWGDTPDGPDYVAGFRGGVHPVELDYRSIWAQDTITGGRWTVVAGLRWDLQRGENEPEKIAANPVAPRVLPGFDYPGSEGGFEWNSLSPRLASTYSLGKARNTQLQASYARYASALGVAEIRRLNPVENTLSYGYFYDTNGNNIWDGTEIDGEIHFLEVDPVLPPFPYWHRNDPDLDPQRTDELLLRVEHAIRPEFVLGANLTLREVSGILDGRRLVSDWREGLEIRAERPEDYHEGTPTELILPDGTRVEVPSRYLAWSIWPAWPESFLLANGGRERTYSGIGVDWTRRLTDRWMVRGYVNYVIQDEWTVPPGFLDGNSGANPNPGKSDCDGCGVAVRYRDPVDETESFLRSRWSWNLNGMVQIAPERPWGFNVAGNLFGRDGYPLPYYAMVYTNDGLDRQVSAVENIDQFQLDDLLLLDLRLDKDVKLASETTMTFSLEGFNLLDERVVLSRDLALDPWREAGSDFVTGALSPRIFRIGIRLGWR